MITEKLRGFFAFFSIEGLKKLQSVIAQLAITLVSICLAIVIVKQLLNTSTRIEPIQVPNSFQEAGLSSKVSAQWLLDEMSKIQSQALTRKESKRVWPKWKELDMELPGSGFSIKTIGDVIRETFGIKQDTINGEIIETQSGYIIRIRQSGQKQQYAQTTIAKDNFESVFEAVALLSLQQLDPFTYASYLHANNQLTAAVAVLKDIIERGNKDILVWAYNLMGVVQNELGNTQLAIDALESTINIDPDFSLAYYNYANVHFKNKEYAIGLKKLGMAKALDPSIEDKLWESKLHLECGKDFDKNKEIEQAQFHYIEATKLNPNLTEAWLKWANTLKKIEPVNLEEIKSKYLHVIELELANSDELLLAKAEAYYNLGEIYLEANNCNEALQSFDFALQYDQYLEKSINRLRAASEFCN